MNNIPGLTTFCDKEQQSSLLEASSQQLNDGDDENSIQDDSPEMIQISSLRCSSIQTEVIAERRKRGNRKSGYPGLAFGSSIFSSGTLMKFNIIANELHNIQNVQLKQVQKLQCVYKAPILSLIF